MPKDTELKVGDWVHVRITGLYTFGEPPYQIESIDGEKYIVVQTEKRYKHRLTVKKEQLGKL
ncbi:hypothetical protein H8D04_01450 [bacterium]|nr:hypothetical protein [bacterium]